MNESLAMIENCGQCEHLASKLTMGLAFYYCSKTPKHLVVPQSSTNDLETGARNATFPRVPMWCPLPDSEAHKQPAPDDKAA